MEFAIRAEDRSDRDDDSKRGDVIAVHTSDGEYWSPIERTDPRWRIVRANILPTLADALMAQLSPQKKVAVFRRRDWMIDLAKLGLDGPRTEAISERTTAQVLSAARRKP